MSNRATRRALLRAVGLALLAPGRVLAQVTYPNRPVRILVPFAPGGGADIVSRLLSPQLQRSLGQSFFVENRAGAAGRIGAGVVAKAEADGHTLLTTTESSLVIAPHIGQAIGYDPLRDFAPISLLTRNTVILVVHPSLPVNSLKEYIALARAKPGQLFYASSGHLQASAGRTTWRGKSSTAWRASTSCTCRFPAPGRRSRRSSPIRSAPCGGLRPG